MTDKQKEYYKSKLGEFLEKDLKININKPFLCLSPEHPDEHPSMSYDKNRHKIHCFACGVDWDIFDLIGALYGITDTKEKFEKVESIIKGTTEGFKEIEEIKEKMIQKAKETQIHKAQEEKPKEILMEYYKKCNENLKKTDYLKKRGISEETANRFYLGYDDHFKGREGQMWGALIIPTTQYTYTARNTDTTADSTNRVKKHGEANIFNFVTIKRSEQPIFITEGEFDVLSFEEVGASAVGLGGVSNIRKLIEKIKEAREEKGEYNNYFLIALDNDRAGEEATAKLKQELDSIGIENYIVKDLYKEFKDGNEFLVNDRERFIKAVKEAYGTKEKALNEELENYKKASSNTEHLQNFINGIGKNIDTEYIPTGFNKLDKILDGGFYEGLYVCGAISSLGKTTLITQIGDQVAERGQDVLIFSLEMARNEIIAKSISRETLLYCLGDKKPMTYAKTTRGITTASRWKDYNNTEKKVIFESMENYGRYAENIYIFEGVGNIGVNEIKEAVEKHIKITGKKPLVIIDYIQILAPIDIRATDKQNVDKIVLELKRMTRDFKITIIGISSLNRSKYNEKISMEAFKESGSIEYGTDVLIGLQLKGAGEKNFDVDEAKAKNPREIELVILKNRNGATGKKIEYKYYPLFNYFEEV